MIVSEFIEMMEEDIKTHNDAEQLSEVLEVMKAVLADMPDADVDGSKTVEDCYKYMYDYASKNRKGNSYYMGPKKSREVVAAYLGVTVSQSATDKPTVSVPSKETVSLEDFF